MSSHLFRRSGSELTSGQVIRCSRGKWDLKGLTHIHDEHLPGGMGLAPHPVCKTSVTVKDLPAEQRLVITHKVPWWVRFLLSLSTCFFHFLIATIVIPRWGIFVNVIIVALPRTVNRNYKEMLYG